MVILLLALNAFTVSDSIGLTLPDSDVVWAPNHSKFAFVTVRGNLQQGCNEYTLVAMTATDVVASIKADKSSPSVALEKVCSYSNAAGIHHLKWMPDNETLAFIEEPSDQPAQVFSREYSTRRRRQITHHPTAVLVYDVSPERIIYAALDPIDWSARRARGYFVGTEPLGNVASKGRESLYQRIAYYVASTANGVPKSVDESPYVTPGLAWGLWLSPSGNLAIALRHVSEAPAEWWSAYEPIKLAKYVAGAQSPDVEQFAIAHPVFFLQYILIDTRSGESHPILDAPAAIPLGATWSADERSVSLANTFSPGGRSPATVEFNVRTEKIRRVRPPPATRHPIDVHVVQGANRPPELVATISATKRSAVITDLNPQYRQLQSGSVETIEWNDEARRKWSGGLLRPSGYINGVRYPLVLQTHGYDPQQFLVDGPLGSSSGFAARSLAAHGIMVLQVNDKIPNVGFRDELNVALDCYRSAIDKLDRDGLIDKQRVGIHGWSRTGFYVQHALVFSNLKFAAASVADASELSAFSSALFFGLYYPGMLEAERLVGSPLWGEEGATLWRDRDPVMHLDRIQTPLKIEDYAYPYLWWDTYVRLRRHGKPVEFLFFPDGAHELKKPWERYTSQTATVDWYDFWLNGHEDPDPSKTEQYERWRAMRTKSGATLPYSNDP